MKRDIGPVTNNPIREFDVFLVKFGQKLEHEFGIVRTLFDESRIPDRYQNRGGRRHDVSSNTKTGDLSASLVVIERRYIMNSSASRRRHWLQDDFGS